MFIYKFYFHYPNENKWKVQVIKVGLIEPRQRLRGYHRGNECRKSFRPSFVPRPRHTQQDFEWFCLFFYIDTYVFRRLRMHSTGSSQQT